MRKVTIEEAASIATGHEILRGLVGSSMHGMAVDGQDDRDEMAICMTPPKYVLGLSEFDHYVYRTQPDGVRSGPGDLDLTVYSLKRYCELAAVGNPSVLMLMWLPEYLRTTSIGDELVGIREAFVSADAGTKYLGYLVGQRMAMTGERNKKVSRPELVEKYGYDTKFAAHAVRLGYQGIDFVKYGKIVLPMQDDVRDVVLSVRTGKTSFDGALAIIADLEDGLDEAIQGCKYQTDVATIEDFLIRSYRRYWDTI